MRDLLPWLDANPVIVPRYAWFQVHQPAPESLSRRAQISAAEATSLSDKATWPLVMGGNLSALGRMYNSPPKQPDEIRESAKVPKQQAVRVTPEQRGLKARLFDKLSEHTRQAQNDRNLRRKESRSGRWRNLES